MKSTITPASIPRQQGARQCEERTIHRPDIHVVPAPEGAAFSISATFNANVTVAQTAVINQAISEWVAIIQTPGDLPNPYPITFQNGPLGNPTIGLHTKTVGDNGLPISSTITFDNDGSTTWFVDATPGDDSEFDPGGSPPAGTDLLSVARHEIGHAMGWTGTTTLTGLLTGTTFDATVWNIQMEPGGTMHADPTTFPNNLMVPGIQNSVRRPIVLYPDSTLGARHYDREIVMKFIDPTAGGPGTGTAVDPWDSVETAFELAPAGAPLLMTPRTYEGSSSGYLLGTAHFLSVANGGAALLTTE